MAWMDFETPPLPPLYCRIPPLIFLARKACCFNAKEDRRRSVHCGVPLHQPSTRTAARLDMRVVLDNEKKLLDTEGKGSPAASHHPVADLDYYNDDFYEDSSEGETHITRAHRHKASAVGVGVKSVKSRRGSVCSLP